MRLVNARQFDKISSLIRECRAMYTIGKSESMLPNIICVTGKHHSKNAPLSTKTKVRFLLVREMSDVKKTIDNRF